MRNQTRYLLLYLCLLCILVGAATQLAQAQDVNQSQSSEQNHAASEAIVAEQINQAELDQMLAPIALYPDTLLSHILVASTYPLELIQAARWRAENKQMDAQQALDAVEDKDWDPSVKALVPFHDLLQKFSQDLDWLQGLGDAFLLNEEQVLSSVQNLRHKAYAQGNLQNNDYLEVSQDEGQIVITTVEKEVIYVPYYDTRVVYGDWWWGAYPPYYWHRPLNYVWSAGYYWSPSFYIGPRFYFGGFHWGNRYVVTNYHYRNNYHSYPHDHQVVSVSEFPQWSHNPVHRRGVRYHHQQNLNRFVSSEPQPHNKKQYQIDKQRVLNIEQLNSKGQHSKQKVVINKKDANSQQASNQIVKNQLKNKRDAIIEPNETRANRDNTYVNDKQRRINAATSQQRSIVANDGQQGQKPQAHVSTENTQTSTKTKGTDYAENDNRANGEKTKTYRSNSDNSSKNSTVNKSQRHSSSEKRESRRSKSSGETQREKH